MSFHGMEDFFACMSMHFCRLFPGRRGRIAFHTFWVLEKFGLELQRNGLHAVEETE